jgi:ATP-dependent helicase HrpB
MALLPITDYKSRIIDSLKSGKNLIIKAPTGSGKSTQVPQFLLDSKLCTGRILILQPRRLAARMLASRVADERCTKLGEEIGFQTRFETLVSKATKACFITEGILPRLLLGNRKLDGISAIIFDEFHERSIATDIGLALAADIQKTVRPDLLIIVMSATIDTGQIKDYLGNSETVECQGRSYPIDIRYTSAPKTTPVWDLAAAGIKTLISENIHGDILVFMPGYYEIKRTVRAIDEAVHGERIKVFPLYGDLPSERQRQVMEELPFRKIIVATNIAETSLTIPGVRHVIDCGLARVNRYDPGRGLNTLFIEPVSLDSAQQRAGRAGREAPGICVRLWGASQQAGRPQRTTPEISRVDLAETILYISILGYGAIRGFPWFEEPNVAALQAGKELLSLLGAIDNRGNPTEYGKYLSEFPMHPRLARLLIEAGKRNAAHLAAFAAAVLSERPAIAGRPEYPEDHSETASDFFNQYCLLEKIRAGNFDPVMCTRFAVNASAAKSIFRTQALFLQYCRRFGIHTRDSGDACSSLARSLLAAYPDHLCVRKDFGTLICFMRNNRSGELARESAARSARILIAADVREIKNMSNSRKTILSMASEIKEEWLIEDFGAEYQSESMLVWNHRSQSVECRELTTCLGVIMSEKTVCISDTAKASELLAETIISKGLKITSWDNNVEQWIKRLQWTAANFPEKQLPCMTSENCELVIHALCDGEVGYERVKTRPILPFLHELLDEQQRQFVDRMAPQAITLPSGWKMRIIYEPGSLPRGRARIQDLYSLKSSPKIADGRIAVSIEVLAPNNRPVQITDDLENFWITHYPGIKKTLSRRYPKHEWR